MARRRRRKGRKSKYCVKAGRKTIRCYTMKSKAKALAKARRRKGLKARVVRRRR